MPIVRRRSRTSLWTPANLPVQPVGWWDAADPLTITLDASGNVSDWKNKGSAGGSASQATAGSRPAFNAAGLNGKPCITADGVDDCLRGLLSISGTDKLYCWAMYRTGNAAANRRVVSIDAGAADWQSVGCAAVIVETGASAIAADRNGARLSTIARPAGTAFIAATEFDGTNVTSYVNGVASTPVASAGLFASTNISLFAQASVSDYIAAAIAEVGIIIGGITPALRQKIEGYRLWASGAQASLPASHPFKNSPPTLF